MFRETPPKGPQKPQNLCTLAADGPKPKTDHILGYVAQNTSLSAPMGCHLPSVKNGSKMCFSKDTFLAPLKAKRALKMGQFATTNGSKTGRNHGFPNDPSPVVVPKRMNTEHILSPF